ncbi:MAG: hypothetical protein JOY71_12400 [Acetobacteraceae bacterium]|nr:hypothetical protein [Acetobacteraceae bacterium]MBV8589730.1 hypothetical protein [Acetobacteraceae bacterium]
MIRAMGIIQVILIASTTVVLAQGNPTQPGPQGSQPSQVLGPTGTMYDGNNANLQPPPEPNGYWARLWAAPLSTGNVGVASGVGAGNAASTVSGPPVGGVH